MRTPRPSAPGQAHLLRAECVARGSGPDAIALVQSSSGPASLGGFRLHAKGAVPSETDARARFRGTVRGSPCVNTPVLDVLVRYKSPWQRPRGSSEGTMAGICVVEPDAAPSENPEERVLSEAPRWCCEPLAN
jgi:hypothetical protein